MTGTPTPRQHELIRDVLRDAGLEESEGLSAALTELRALVPDRAPEPRADLAALLAGGAPAVLPAGVISLAERRGRKRRMAAAGGAVVVAMTFGAGAVAAASEDFRAGVEQTVGVILKPVAPAPQAAPTPEPSPAAIPVEPFMPLAQAEPVQVAPEVPAAVPATATEPAAVAPAPPQEVLPPAPAARHTAPGRDRILPPVRQIPPGLASAPGQVKKAAKDTGKAVHPGRGNGREKNEGKRP